ncbi:MAG: DNA/RNA nuclease SfsA, partial [Deltaproteobacteria bacterium]|nr:DNA/RNA nuclease SfsA [Deltaproteobacteria bacterium]
KRFLAEVMLDNGRQVTAHCPNTGSMLKCLESGRRVFLSAHNTPSRRLPYTWELIDMPDSLVGVNTAVPNRLVRHAIQADLIPSLTGYQQCKAEVRTSPTSRLDLMLTSHDRQPCYIEIKNCTLVEDGTACFPDAVTTRGRKHLDELTHLVDQGMRGVIFFLVQRMDAEVFRPADHIDPVYGQTLRQALAKGVEAMAWDVNITLSRIDLCRELPVELA